MTWCNALPFRARSHSRCLDRRRLFYRPALEPLEARWLPAVISWKSGGSGDWSLAGNWDLNRVPGAGDDVVINVSGGYNVGYSASSGTSTVNSIASPNPNVSLTISGGRLNVTGNMQVSGRFRVEGGTLAGATVAAGTTVRGGNQNGRGTLDGVTISTGAAIVLGSSIIAPDGIGSEALDIRNGLTLNGTATFTYGGLRFLGTQTLAGTGTAIFDTGTSNALAVINSGTTLTIGSGITVRGRSGTIGTTSVWGSATNVNFVNHGTISADVSGDTIQFRGEGWYSTGTLRSLVAPRSNSAAWSPTPVGPWPCPAGAPSA